MIKVKIIQAVVDSNVDDFLENQIERWLVSSPSQRNILRIDTAMTIKEILLFITFNERPRTDEELDNHLKYLYKEGRRIFGRNLEYEELKSMGFQV